MKEETIVKLCEECLAELPKEIERCAVGHGNYVYIVELADRKVVVRCSEETGAYKDTIYWLEKLETIDIPVPRVLGKGMFEGYEYLILTYFEGQDIGLVYTTLTDEEKREIAKTVVGRRSVSLQTDVISSRRRWIGLWKSQRSRSWQSILNQSNRLHIWMISAQRIC